MTTQLKIVSCINLQLQIIILETSSISDMHHGMSCIYIYISIFSVIGWVDQSNACTLIYLQKIARCTNLQLPIVFFKESIMSDMHRGKAYMYINFQQNRVNRSVITAHTNLFAKKNRKLHKFATTNSNFKKIHPCKHASL